MNNEIKIKKFEDIPVMYIEKAFTMEQFNNAGDIFEKICSYIEENNGEITGSFILYNECTEEIMNVDLCVCVKELLPEKLDIKSKIVSGGEINTACAIHKGSYKNLSKTWEDLMTWINKQGYTFDNLPMREIYINPSMDIPESDFLTEIVVPVKKA